MQKDKASRKDEARSELNLDSGDDGCIKRISAAPFRVPLGAMTVLGTERPR